MDDEHERHDRGSRMDVPERLMKRMLRYLERYHGENHFNRWEYIERGFEGLLADGHVQKVAEVSFPRSMTRRPGVMFFEMPNTFRPTFQSLGLTGTPDEFTNRELSFIDNYPDLSEWDLDSDAFDGNIPDVLVYDDEFSLVEKELAGAMDSDGFDIAGEYAPFYPEEKWLGRPDWGIYIYTEIIDKLAKSYFRGQDIEPFQAWMVSFRAILYHEYFHFLSEYHCRRLAKTRPNADRYYEYSKTMLSSLKNEKERKKVKEEAVANAYSHHRLYKHAKKEWFSPIARMFDAGGEPYSQYKSYIGPTKRQSFGFAVILAQHDTFWPIPTYRTFNEKAASAFFPKPNVDVPVFLVSSTDKLRLLNGAYRIHPEFFEDFPNAIPFTVEIEKTIQALNDKDFKSMNKLFSTADEKMTYYEGGKRLGYNIAVFSQIRDSNSIWLVYFGSKYNCPYEL